MHTQLTIAIDTASMIQHRLEEYAELEGVGQCLTVLNTHISHLETLREDIGIPRPRKVRAKVAPGVPFVLRDTDLLPT